MLSYRQYRGLPILTESDQTAQNYISEIESEIDLAVNLFYQELIKELSAKPSETQSRSLWDRFKNAMSNIALGRYNTSNPYYHKNLYGDILGSKKNENQDLFVSLPYSLNEFKSIKTILNDIDSCLNEALETDSLRIVNILKQHANRLKDTLKKIIRTNLTRMALDAAKRIPTPSTRVSVPEPALSTRVSTPEPVPSTPTSAKPAREAEPAPSIPSSGPSTPDSDMPSTRLDADEEEIDVSRVKTRTGRAPMVARKIADLEKAKEALNLIKEKIEEMQVASDDELSKKHRELNGKVEDYLSNPRSLKIPDLNALLKQISNAESHNGLLEKVDERYQEYKRNQSFKSNEEEQDDDLGELQDDLGELQDDLSDISTRAEFGD